MRILSRWIDHVVVAVQDLDAAGAFYQRLGFQVGARNHHPWGTENRLIQFGTSFIELITVASAGAIPDHEPGRFSFGAFVRDYLLAREGLAMLALASDDAGADAALFAENGIGPFAPFFFERKARRPDGRVTDVAFTLAFAADPKAPEAGFFVCQHHFPENFWNPVFQQHGNGATAIAVVGMMAANPEAHESFLTAFTGSPGQRNAQGRLSIELRDGRLEVYPGASSDTAPRLDLLTIRVPNVAILAERLRVEGVAADGSRDILCIPADSAYGVELRFCR